MARLTISRDNVLGLRMRAQGLDRRPAGVERVLRLGLQDTPYGSARAAYHQRVDPGAGDPQPMPEMLVWSWRGAPHLHRADDLEALAAALWPLDDADATRRIRTGQLQTGARRGVEAFTLAATAMRQVIRSRMSKGEVSAAVSALIPADLTYDCASCRARHISGALFQAAGLGAGVRVVPQGNQTFLEPLPTGVGPPETPTTASGTAAALRHYVRVLGPAGSGELASFLGTTRAIAERAVPDGLTEVEGPSARCWVAEEDLDDLRAAAPLRLTRLLPPGDPWLQARDRDLIVPVGGRQREVWRVLGNPGVVLVDGEVAGLWRAKAGKRLAVSITPFEGLSRRVTAEVEAEAQLVAAGRGAKDADVTFGA